MAALFRTSNLADVEAGLVDLAPLPALVLARIATERGATRAEILRDIGRLTDHKLSPGEWRKQAESELVDLLDGALIDNKRTRYTATDDGDRVINRFLNKAENSKTLSWSEQRDTFLVAKALGLSELSITSLKSLKRPDGLRAIIVQHAFDLPLKGNQTAQQLRASLAVVALGRAFGNKIETGLGASKDFSVKASRALAGQLSERPREFLSDGKLIAALAAEVVDARQADFDSLQSAILRRFASAALTPHEPAKQEPCVKVSGTVATTNKAPKTKNIKAPPKNSCEPPDLQRFAQCVQQAARELAEGWPGNQKAFISHVWQSIRSAHASWGISEIEFKCMLAEAHRAGHVVLANADLKNKNNIAEIEASAVAYKNTVWHLIRVSEEAS
ncbi:MAG: hypothetical protein ACRBCJ_11340 [Hyphomicrobiaceae bacterium]